MAVLFVLGGAAIVVGLVGVFMRLVPGKDADQRPQHSGGRFGGPGGGGGFGGCGNGARCSDRELARQLDFSLIQLSIFAGEDWSDEDFLCGFEPAPDGPAASP